MLPPSRGWGVSAGIARRLEGLLEGQGWTQPALARALGTKQGVVQRWFSGRALPSATWLGPLCRVCGVSCHWLLTGEGPMAPPDAAEGTAGVREFEAGYQAGLQAARRAIEDATPARPVSAETAMEAARLHGQAQQTEERGRAGKVRRPR